MSSSMLFLIGIILLILELITISTFLIWIAFGFIAASIAAFFTDNLYIITAIGIFVFIGTIIPFRQKYFNRLQVKKDTKTGIDRIIGKKGFVKKAFHGQKSDLGIVYVGNITWNASSEENEYFEEGEEVLIKKVEGNTLVVKKIKN